VGVLAGGGTGAFAGGRSEEVSWPLGETVVDGTLLTPDGPGPFPGVVLVAGSGPTDRDWNTPLLPGSNGSGRLLAEALAQAGFASLRYDKRVVGPHARSNLAVLGGRLTMADHAAEVASATRQLAAQPTVRADRLFALAHSEGTLHALHHQLSGEPVPFAGLVLIGPPGRPVGELARAQLASQLADAAERAEVLRLYDEAIARFLAGEPAAPDGRLPAVVRALLQSLDNPLNLPFVRELWTANPARLLRDVSAPVLVVIGQADVQVDWRTDGDALRRAADGRQDVTFLFPEQADHVLKHRSTGGDRAAATLYNAAGERLDEEACQAIVRWLRERC